MIAVLVVITALCIWMLEEERLQAAVKKKQTALTMEYASFLYKLMALLRAGLTIRGAFERLAQSRQVREHYIDEEIRRCCNEMKSGDSGKHRHMKILAEDVSFRSTSKWERYWHRI